MKATFFVLAMAFTPALTYAQSTFPDGPGKVLVVDQCASCHGLDQIAAHRDTPDGWAGLVDFMVSRGMASTEEEVKTMVEYLAKSFPAAPKPAADKGKSK